MNWYLGRGGDDDDDEVDERGHKGKSRRWLRGVVKGERGRGRWGRRRGTVKKNNNEVERGKQKNVMVVNIWRVE